MADDLGTVREDQTIYFGFTTAAADGGEESFSGTLEEGDFIVRKDGSTLALDASTITVTVIATGVYEVAIDLSNDSDFTTGSQYLVYVDPDTETVDSQNVSGYVARFRIESDDEQAVRLLRQYLYPTNAAISTTTNNTTTSINLTEIVDADTTDISGELLAVHDSTNDEVWFVRVTAFSYPQATVEALDGGEMPAAVAAGDHVWRVGQFTATDGAFAALATATILSGVSDNTDTILTTLGAAGAGLTAITGLLPSALSSGGFIKADIQTVAGGSTLTAGGNAPSSPYGES